MVLPAGDALDDIEGATERARGAAVGRRHGIRFAIGSACCQKSLNHSTISRLTVWHPLSAEIASRDKPLPFPQ